MVTNKQKRTVKMRKTKELKFTLGDQEGGSMIVKKITLCNVCSF
jgi:hypothetical protein